MEVTGTPSTAEAVPAAAETMSPVARAIAVFTSPSRAFAGLKFQSQWWFPILVVVLCSAALTAVLYQRAVVPMITDQWDQMVEDGKLPPEQAQRMEEGMRGPMGLVWGVVPQVVMIPLLMLLMAAGLAFGVNFILGTRLPFRQSFETVAWANLVMLPAGIVTSVLAWSKETMKGIHLGPGILVPMSDPPEKWQIGLGSFLDAFGPFEIWTLALVIIGATILSGAPRKSVTGVVIGLYLAARVIGAALGAMFAPGV
jgi:hypothetical protein